MGTLGRTLRLFLADGTPNGIVFAEIINWSGQVIRVPRGLVSQFIERKESNRTGVYLLVGSDEEVPGRLRIYVGESDNLGERLRQHANKEPFEWDYACVTTSKDQNLTKAHGLFLESQIIKQSIAADRATLINAQTSVYENIPESDISDMTYFFEQISVLLPALGVELFSPAPLQRKGISSSIVPFDTPPTTPIYERRKTIPALTGDDAIEVILRDGSYGIEARGYESNGEILVSKGSQARGENESRVNVYKNLRDRLQKEGKLVQTPNPKILEFADDVLFNSPSAASAVILDRNDNGRTSWKEKTSGKSLNEWYAEQANTVQQPGLSP